MSPKSKFLQYVETCLKEHFPGTEVKVAIRDTIINGLELYALVDDVSACVAFDIFDFMTEERYAEDAANLLIDNIEKVLARRKND